MSTARSTPRVLISPGRSCGTAIFSCNEARFHSKRDVTHPFRFPLPTSSPRGSRFTFSGQRFSIFGYGKKKKSSSPRSFFSFLSGRQRFSPLFYFFSRLCSVVGTGRKKKIIIIITRSGARDSRDFLTSVARV